MLTALAVTKNVLLALETLIQLDSALRPLIVSTNKIIALAESEGRDPTPEEWAGLDLQLSSLRAALAAPSAGW